MSSTRQTVPRPRSPFLPADDGIEEIDAEPISSEPPQPVVTLDSLTTLVVQGFAAMHDDTRMIRRDILQLREDLSPRVAKLEGDSATRRWAMHALKAAGPFIAGIVAARYPELAKHLPALLGALTGTQ